MHIYHIGRSIIHVLGTGPRDRPRDPRTSELRGRSSCAGAPRRFVVVVSCVVRIYMHDAARHSARTAARKLTAMGFLWHLGGRRVHMCSVLRAQRTVKLSQAQLLIQLHVPRKRNRGQGPSLHAAAPKLLSLLCSVVQTRPS